MRWRCGPHRTIGFPLQLLLVVEPLANTVLAKRVRIGGLLQPSDYTGRIETSSSSGAWISYDGMRMEPDESERSGDEIENPLDGPLFPPHMANARESPRKKAFDASFKKLLANYKELRATKGLGKEPWEESYLEEQEILKPFLNKEEHLGHCDIETFLGSFALLHLLQRDILQILAYRRVAKWHFDRPPHRHSVRRTGFNNEFTWHQKRWELVTAGLQIGLSALSAGIYLGLITPIIGTAAPFLQGLQHFAEKGVSAVMAYNQLRQRLGIWMYEGAELLVRNGPFNIPHYWQDCYLGHLYQSFIGVEFLVRHMVAKENRRKIMTRAASPRMVSPLPEGLRTAKKVIIPKGLLLRGPTRPATPPSADKIKVSWLEHRYGAVSLVSGDVRQGKGLIASEAIYKHQNPKFLRRVGHTSVALEIMDGGCRPSEGWIYSDEPMTIVAKKPCSSCLRAGTRCRLYKLGDGRGWVQVEEGNAHLEGPLAPGEEIHSGPDVGSGRPILSKLRQKANHPIAHALRVAIHGAFYVGGALGIQPLWGLSSLLAIANVTGLTALEIAAQGDLIDRAGLAFLALARWEQTIWGPKSAMRRCNILSPAVNQREHVFSVCPTVQFRNGQIVPQVCMRGGAFFRHHHFFADGVCLPNLVLSGPGDRCILHQDCSTGYCHTEGFAQGRESVNKDEIVAALLGICRIACASSTPGVDCKKISPNHNFGYIP